MLRILLASMISNNRWTGMGKWTHRIAEALQDSGHDVDKWFADDFSRRLTSGSKGVLIGPALFTSRLLKNLGKYDAVVVHEPLGAWLATARRFTTSFPATIAMCHNVESENFRTLTKLSRHGLAEVPRTSRLKAPLFRHWQSDAFIRNADHVVCLSTRDVRAVQRRFGRCEGTTTLMLNGVDRTEIVQRTHHHRANLRIIFVGGWLDVKGRRLLPLIWKRVETEIPEASLTLVGTGCADDRVLECFPGRGHGRVINIPRVTEPLAISNLMLEHDLFILPSLSEGSPLALLEAMATATPIVAASVGGVPDLVRNQVEAALFDCMDIESAARQTITLLRHSAMRERIGHAAQAKARELTWDASARAVLHAIRNAIEHTQKRSSRM